MKNNKLPKSNWEEWHSGKTLTPSDSANRASGGNRSNQKLTEVGHSEGDISVPNNPKQWEIEFNEKFHEIGVLMDIDAKEPRYFGVIFPKDRIEDDEYDLGDVKAFISKWLQQERDNLEMELCSKAISCGGLKYKDIKEIFHLSEEHKQP